MKENTPTTPTIEALSAAKQQINQQHLDNGVRLLDPATTYIEATVKIAPGVTIYPNTVLEGHTSIETETILYPGCHLINATIGKGVTIRQSVVADSTIGNHSQVGPFAYLRQQAHVGENCRIGDFVEIKNAQLDQGVKAAHLAYIGDADVGKEVNYSCGAITSNYDGKNKHRTTIGDHAFIGSNVNLVAPVTIGRHAFVAAGSTITEDLQENSLGIARARQVEKLQWVKSHG